MPSNAPGYNASCLLIGPEPWTQERAQWIESAMPLVRVDRCTNAEEALLLPGFRRASLLVAALPADDPDPVLAEIAQSERSPPLLICARPDAPSAVLMDLMAQGTFSVVQDGEPTLLVRALRTLTHFRTAHRNATGTQALEAGSDLEGIRILADREQRPLVLVIDDTIVHANPAFHELLQLSARDRTSGRSLLDFAAPSSARTLRAMLARSVLLNTERAAPETIDLVSLSGQAITVLASADPLPMSGAEGVAISLARSGVDAFSEHGAEAKANVRQGRADLLARLAVLTDEGAALERMSLLVLGIVSNYAEQRARLGFTKTAALLDRLAGCLTSAAPQGTATYTVADDVIALLIEDISTPEVERLRRRIMSAPSESEDSSLLKIGLEIGTVVAEPGPVTAKELLDRALADAQPSDTQIAGVSTSIDCRASDLSVDSGPASEGNSSTVGPISVFDLKQEPLPQSESSSDQEKPPSERSLIDRIDRALEGDGFALAFQPIISLVGDSREHYSVLLRLKEPDGSLATADRIIAAANGSERMIDIDRWVIQSAMRQLGQRRRYGEKAALFLSLSPEIVQEDQLMIWICDAMREFQVRGSWLTFQMRQRDARAQLERWSVLAQGLREVRCRVCVNQQTTALDESLDGMERPDFVKFAPTLAEGFSRDRDKQRHLLEMIRVARNGHCRTVVTGIQDSRALSFLWDAGIEYVQGDYLCPPSLSLDAESAPSHGGADKTMHKG
jgi:EAL domain-containing protein (putative c-di-GMP-specific phosphodiesterase class I)/PAS domain-containing protein